MTTPADFVPLAIATRSDVDESVHFGAIVALDPDGSIAFAHGNPDTLVYPRSSLKPMQALAMVQAGLDLPPELLAVVCASHDGLPMHLQAVLAILERAGLGEDALANTADLPLDRPEAEHVLRSGGGRTPLQMNCSGKHAGMLATCVVNGWAHDASYLDREHPLQQAIDAVMADLTGEPLAHVGLDGCGAPTHMFSLLGLARAFRAISHGDAGEAGDRIHGAMSGHPEMVGGPTRDVTAFMQHVPGLMAKDGAEGVFAAALPDGRAIALKIADGANRARPPVMVGALAQLGIDTSTLAAAVEEQVRGHGRVVGTVRSLL